MDSITNLGSRQLPLRFRLTKFSAVANAKSASDLRVLATIDGVAESIAETSGDTDIRIAAPSATAVFDSRAEGLVGGLRCVSYLLKASNWISEADVAHFRSTAISNASVVPSHISSQRKNSPASRRLIIIAFAAVTGLAAMLIICHKGCRKVN